MLSSDKTEMLRSFLGTLPEEVASRLARAVEMDRLLEGSALPHNVILEGLRPALRDTEVHQRTPTPLRLFCRPFEDLLVNTSRKEKQRGRIARVHVVPVWNWLSKTLLPAESASYGADIRKLVLERRLDESVMRAEPFWPVAGEAIRNAVAANPQGARTALGGDLAVADAEEMAILLRSGTAIRAVQALLPKPTPALSEELLHGLRRIYDHVIESDVDAGPFISVVAMRRLAKPWEALKLALLITRQSQDTLLSSTDMGLAGDILLVDMEDCRTAIMAARHPVFDADALVADLAKFTEISSAIVKEVEILRRGKWGQRLLKDRAAVGATMDGFMERAPKEIAAALPSHKAGFTGGPQVPDFTRPVDPERVERAVRYAKLISGTKLLAVPGSFGAKHQDALENASHILRSYNEDLLKELRISEGERRTIVEQQYKIAGDLTALVFDESEAEFFHRRAKAAVSQSAAA
jgi:hypothetical protein